MNNLKVQPTKTPVVLIIFNRPAIAQQVFNAIRAAKPQKLFVIADGPRFAEEQTQCEQTRKIIEQVDWDCKVLTNFSPVNLGCKQRVVTGLNWVFSLVEEAIILEDDCLPTLSFFSFCDELIEYYRYDERIFIISGNNFQNNIERTSYSYYFCKYNHTWGWATWRRAWRYWDDRADTWLSFRDDDMMPNIWADSYSQIYWEAAFNGVFLHDLSSIWDLIWQFNCWSQNGLSISPKHNLVSNIGFGFEGTHCKQTDNPLANLPTTDIWEISHPGFVIPNLAADRYAFDFVYEGNRIVTDLINANLQVNTLADHKSTNLDPKIHDISEDKKTVLLKQPLITFIDWEQPDHEIYQELCDIACNIINNKHSNSLPLIIYANEQYFEKINQMLLALMMDLAVDPSLTNLVENIEPDISIVSELTLEEWQDLQSQGLQQIKLNNSSLVMNISLPFNLPIFSWQNSQPDLEDQGI